jgi:hypothetical protein
MGGAVAMPGWAEAVTATAAVLEKPVFVPAAKKRRS